MQQWKNFQTSILLLFIVPAAMGPTRECVLVYLRQPAFFIGGVRCAPCQGAGAIGLR